jgi:group I intron endonuclease
MIKKAGIYQIINIINNHSYIGQTSNLAKRPYAHFYNAESYKNNKNKVRRLENDYFQKAYEKYGVTNFSVKILEEVSYQSINELKIILYEREQYWIDIIKPEYNSASSSKSNLGIKFSDEAKLNLSKGHIGNNSRKGTFHTKEQKEKISKALKGKYIGEKALNVTLNDSKVRGIKILLSLKFTQKYIAKLYEVTRPTIGYIARKITWTHIK